MGGVSANKALSTTLHWRSQFAAHCSASSLARFMRVAHCGELSTGSSRERIESITSASCAKRTPRSCCKPDKNQRESAATHGLRKRKPRAARVRRMLPHSAAMVAASETPMKVLVAVDGSEYTKRMLGYLGAQAELLSKQNDYPFLTVVTPLPPHVESYISRADSETYARDEAEKTLKPVRAFVSQQGLKGDVQFRIGHAAD